ADGSVGFPHVRVGHRQDSIPEPLIAYAVRGFVCVASVKALLTLADDPAFNLLPAIRLHI
ncbi:hypothetical protein V2J93_21945, partial [Pseudomonas alliivorans]|nr:hypothetical protein [Pseudomonas alliivorans]